MIFRAQILTMIQAPPWEGYKFNDFRDTNVGHISGILGGVGGYDGTELPFWR